MPDDEKTVEYVEVSFPTFYTNSVVVSHSVFEFSMLIMERLDPTNATVRARIVTSAAHAKLLAAALAQQVAKYEAMFGEIVVPQMRDAKPSSGDPSTEPEPQP
jgi:hypothetical protein